ncbi:MAG: acetate uptake transporter [Chloroflexi bacterium]|nr:acetate uptake transporter [Chloroflexota bacterium]
MARDVRTTDTAVATPAVADPAPLGLAGFALTTVLLSAFNAGRIPLDSGGLIFVGMAMFYGGLGQFMAGMWEFKNRNTFGATAFSSFGAFWMGVALLFILSLAVGQPKGTLTLWFGHVGNIWFFFIWAVFTTYMFVASLRTNGVVALVFFLLALTFWVLWIGAPHNDAPGKGWTGFGGTLGFLTAIAAFYGSFAGVVNSTFGRVIAPVFPLTGTR